MEEENVLRIKSYGENGDVEYSDTPGYMGDSDAPDDDWESQQSYAPVQTQPAASTPNYERDSNDGYAKYSFKAGGSFEGRT